MEIWNRHFECMNRKELKKVQNERLRETVERVYFNVPYYRHKMQEAGLGPESISSVDDLSKLPFTTKTDLRDNYPFGLFAVPMSEIVRVHASSGTTGKPTVVGYTRNDIGTWSEVMARTLTCAGANRNDFIQVAYGYGLFTGGLGIHYGGEKIGASVFLYREEIPHARYSLCMISEVLYWHVHHPMHYILQKLFRKAVLTGMILN
jgi:phenylacetate-CoA ligase